MAGGCSDADCSLEQLEGEAWPEPAEPCSSLERRVHALRRKPLRDLTDADLRVAIGQAVGLPHLVPIALRRLSPKPLIEAELYEGDMLCALLRVPPSFWRAYEPLRAETYALQERVFRNPRGEHRALFTDDYWDPDMWQVWHEIILPVFMDARAQFLAQS